MTAGTFVGLDVQGTGIQVAVRPTGEGWVTAVDDQGISETAERLKSMRPELVVMEAQGKFELPLAGTFATVGLPFALVPPRNIRDFAKAVGRRDQNQAGLLAYFAELVRPEVRTLSPDVVDQLRALKRRRHEIREMLSAERARLDQEPSAIHSAIPKDLKGHIFFLERSFAAISEEISRTVRSSSVWR
jgi:transposase